VSYDPVCEQCHMRPKMDRCDICEECWYAPRKTWICPHCGRLEDGTGPCAHTYFEAMQEGA
jgi:hypothetical protein